MRDPRPTVLVVEENAHWPIGHSPVRFAQLATAFAELGYRVDVLTTWGWVRAHEHPDAPFTVFTYRGAAHFVRRLASWCKRTKRPAAARVGEDLTALALALGARSHARSMDPRPDAVVILGWITDPVMVGAVVGRGRWLLYQFGPSTFIRAIGGAPLSGLVEALARRQARRRTAAGGAFRVAVPTEARRADWAARSSTIDAVVLPIAGVRDFTPVDHAREQLGIPVDAKVALLFGDVFMKRSDTVFAAFAELPEWTLVVGGPVAHDVSDPNAARCNLVTFPGNVDDALRDLLFSSADLVVLSFVEGYANNSGTLMDAISAGVPVACSTPSAASELVAAFRLGGTFPAGDAGALRSIVRDATARVAPADLAAARDELSNRAVAAHMIDAVR